MNEPIKLRAVFDAAGDLTVMDQDGRPVARVIAAKVSQAWNRNAPSVRNDGYGQQMLTIDVLVDRLPVETPKTGTTVCVDP